MDEVTPIHKTAHTVMPDLIRHAEQIENAGFRFSLERRMRATLPFLVGYEVEA